MLYEVITMQKMNHLEKLNILYLEDEDIIRNNVSTMLQYLFNEVYATSCVSDAISCFETKEVHIILSDISMPGKNGLDFIEHLRSKRVNIPVILLTAHTDTDFLFRITSYNVCYTKLLRFLPGMLISLNIMCTSFVSKHDIASDTQDVA